MDFLKKLNEEYRLFSITDDGIEEIDIDSLLTSDDFDDEGNLIPADDSEVSADDDLGFADDNDFSDGGDTYNLRKGTYNKNLSPNVDDGLDSLPPDEDSFSLADDDEYDIFSADDGDDDDIFVGSTADVLSDDEGVVADLNFADSDTPDFSNENPNNYGDGMDDIEDFESGESNIEDEGDLVGLDGVADGESDIPDFDDISDEEYTTHMNGGIEAADVGAGESDDEEFNLFGSDDYEGEEAQGDLEGVGADVEEGEEDSDFQGVIRTVKGANLVYKRQNPDGTFTELWIQNIGKDMKRESEIRRAILAGTDIPPTKETSDDGSQTSELTTMGNVQFLKIDGLPS